MPKQLIFIPLALVLAGIIGWALNDRGLATYIKSNRTSGYVVELRDDGFHPQELTIPKGTAVTFTTTRNTFFWPASDLHPTHTIYPEFDPREPFPPDKSWSFRFEKIGEWKYHDHLAPYFTGVITVVEDTQGNPTESVCKERPHSVECWQEKLLGVLNKKGVEATFDLIAKLYADEPRFATSCHYLTHNVGLAAYKLYLQNPESILTPKTSFCANGFYHGFMESLLVATQGDVKRARAFCSFIDEKMTPQSPDAALQCYHGIGHGVMDFAVGNKSVWGDERAMTIPALKLCEEASETEDQLYRCASGVFNAIANFYIKGEYRLSARRDNPLWLCREQPEQYKDSCYGNMNTTLLWLAKNNLPEAAAFVERIKDDVVAISAMRYLTALAAIYVAQSNPEASVFACRSLQERLRLPCFEGLAHGFLEHGSPGKEYQDALHFCQSEMLTREEHGVCFRYVASNLYGWYAKEKAKSICLEEVEENFRRYCISSR